MVTFYPVWATPVGALSSVTENDSVAITLHAARHSSFMGQDSQAIIIGNSATFITNVNVNGVDLSDAVYQIDGNTLVFDSIISSSDIIDLTTSETITYTLLHDNLPPGLTLSNTGVISGKVGILPTIGPALTYSFGVRISDGTNVRDRQFTILAIPATVEVSPPGWGNLPSAQIEHAEPAAFRYVPLPQTTRGTPYEYQLDLFVPSGIPPTLVVQSFFDATTITAPFNSIPPGLSVDVHTGLVSGTVETSTPLGQYFFQIEMLDSRGNPITVGTGAHPVVFMLDIAAPFSALAPLSFIIWTTPAGLLATMNEGQSFPLGVKATCTTGEAVTYALSSSTPLPDGLTLNTVTGDIQGIIGHIPRNRDYTFIIRASVGQVFQDQTFSISVVVRYTSAEFANVNFKLRAVDSLPMATYYSNTIQQGDYFRSTDPSFGDLTLTNSLKIFMVGGLNGDLTALETVVRASLMDAPVKLLLGPHKVAYARINGTVIYEVLYREVEDPMAKAGGYTVLNGVPTVAPILYPESIASSPQFISPASINNIRNEFVSKIGFPTLDATIANNLSLAAGAENLPLWMTCPQTGTDATTALGYIPAVVIAYLAPGAGQTVLNRISLRVTDAPRPTDDADPVATGHEVDFDQYFIEFQSVTAPTTFDGNTTTFDGQTLILDVFVISGGTFFRMNRATFNTTS